MNFGKWIFVSFVAFALFIISLATICIRQDINLVSKNYYADELNHQQKIDQETNTSLLRASPQIIVDGTYLKVLFPWENRIASGKLTMLRPSDPSLDKQFDLSNGQREYAIQLSRFSKGLYRASIQWNMDGKDFFFEKLISI